MDYVGAIIWNKLHRMQPGARSGSSQRSWWLGPDCYSANIARRKMALRMSVLRAKNALLFRRASSIATRANGYRKPSLCAG
jgi:hypothetical protein